VGADAGSMESVIRAQDSMAVRSAGRASSRYEPSETRWAHQNVQAEQASMIFRKTASASVVPSASPFSKSSPVCPMVFVTWARQRTPTPAALAKV